MSVGRDEKRSSSQTSVTILESVHTIVYALDNLFVDLPQRYSDSTLVDSSEMWVKVARPRAGAGGGSACRATVLCGGAGRGLRHRVGLYGRSHRHDPFVRAGSRNPIESVATGPA